MACAESIKPDALLCRHCGTDQRDPRFSGPQNSLTALSKISESESASESPNRVGGISSINSIMVAGVLAVLVVVIAIVAFGSKSSEQDEIPAKTTQQKSFELGVQAGKALIAQNRTLWPEVDLLCADAFDDYAPFDNVDFDSFFSGCKSAW